MPGTTDKLNRFELELMKTAHAQAEQIYAEMKKYKADEIDKAQDDVLEDAYHLIQSEVSELSVQAKKEASEKTLKYRKKLIEVRDKAVTEIFSEVKEQLAGYCKTEEYARYIIKLVEGFRISYPFPNSIIKLAKSDEEKKEAVMAAFGLPCEVICTDEVKIGGAILENAAKGYIVNETLDQKLEDQKEWFRRNSGLVVTL